MISHTLLPGNIPVPTGQYIPYMILNIPTGMHNRLHRQTCLTADPSACWRKRAMAILVSFTCLQDVGGKQHTVHGVVIRNKFFSNPIIFHVKKKKKFGLSARKNMRNKFHLNLMRDKDMSRCCIYSEFVWKKTEKKLREYSSYVTVWFLHCNVKTVSL